MPRSAKSSTKCTFAAVENVANLRRRGVELRAEIEAAVRREDYGDAHRCKSALVKIGGLQERRSCDR